MSDWDDVLGNELTVRACEDLVISMGVLEQMTVEWGYYVAHIRAPAVPCYQQVVEWLWRKPTPSWRSMRLADEARAAAAVCLRWGSYFAFLADETLPLSPAAREPHLSLIHDEEMARMNIEISAAIAWWLTLKGSDHKQYAQLVARAVAYLPLGRKTVACGWGGDTIFECAIRAMARAMAAAWPLDDWERITTLASEHGTRAIANSITLLAFRNGPIEDVHAGQFVQFAPNQRRIAPRPARAVMRQAQDVLYGAMFAMKHLIVDCAWPPPPLRVLPFLRPFMHSLNWSYSEVSRDVHLAVRRAAD